MCKSCCPDHFVSSNSLGIICYVPDKSFGNPDEFLANLAAYPSQYPLIKYSHADWPDCIRLKGSPEIVSGAVDDKGRPKLYAISNMIFFTGLRIAMAHKFTHILVLEPDCRVGPDWDSIMFDEFFKNSPPIMGGSIVIHNPCNHNLATIARWKKFVCASKGICPVQTFGNKSCSETGNMVVRTNGALSIFTMSDLLDIFTPEELENSAGLARKSLEWDLEIGLRFSIKYDYGIFDRIKHLSTIWSTFGNVLSTEDERLKMLADGKVVGVHQIKRGKR